MGLKFPSRGQRELTSLAWSQRELGHRQLPGQSPGRLREVTEGLGASGLSRRCRRPVDGRGHPSAGAHSIPAPSAPSTRSPGPGWVLAAWELECSTRLIVSSKTGIFSIRCTLTDPEKKSD